MYFYHNDHLGTPEQMTDEIGNLIWTGTDRPNSRPRPTTPSELVYGGLFPGATRLNPPRDVMGNPLPEYFRFASASQIHNHNTFVSAAEFLSALEDEKKKNEQLRNLFICKGGSRVMTPNVSSGETSNNMFGSSIYSGKYPQGSYILNEFEINYTDKYFTVPGGVVPECVPLR